MDSNSYLEGYGITGIFNTDQMLVKFLKER